MWDFSRRVQQFGGIVILVINVPAAVFSPSSRLESIGTMVLTAVCEVVSTALTYKRRKDHLQRAAQQPGLAPVIVQAEPPIIYTPRRAPSLNARTPPTTTSPAQDITPVIPEDEPLVPMAMRIASPHRSAGRRFIRDTPMLQRLRPRASQGETPTERDASQL